MHDPISPEGDPTTRTIETLHREIAGLEGKVKILLEGIEQITDEKFHSVERQFELVERQRAEQKVDTKQAVDAALTAQKEAVKEQTTASERAIAKSETATTKQLDQLAVTFATAINGVTTLLNDLKERVAKVEASKQGVSGAATQLIAVLGLLMTIGMGIFVIATR